MTTDSTIYRGLKGVVIDKTNSSFIDGVEGRLMYRGYNYMTWPKNLTSRKQYILY